MVRIEDARRVAFAGADGAVVVQQLAQFLHRVANVRAQHVFTEELMEHLADRAFQEGDAAGMPGTVPGIGAVLRVIQKRLQKGWLDAFQIGTRLADKVPRHELRRVLIHMDHALQLAKDVVRNMPGGLGFAVQVDRHVRVAAPDFVDEFTQRQQRGRHALPVKKLLVVDGEYEGAGTALLLREQA